MFLNGWRKIEFLSIPNSRSRFRWKKLVGVSSCVAGDMASHPNWGLNELDFVFSTLVVGSILNSTLMYLLAHTMSASSTRLPGIFANCPTSHMFEPGPFSIINRFGTLVYKGIVFSIVGFAVGLVGTAMPNGLINLGKKMDPTFENTNKPSFVILARLTGSQSFGEDKVVVVEVGSAAEKEKLADGTEDLQNN
ncbi:DUF3411 domain-containing protein [Cephalotus follicularis]|uniref:DUF3411 domain-containing protein n=1 Tax=Cephalotus follicularis TaxID=3775 RepID=A0A1Q3CRK7_CEPFO|nr:DUF3411 domain-containing protein [Cephalotus follicularis]